MGCKSSQCQDQSEFVLTQPLPSFEDTVVSSIFSDKSTKPSIDTFLRNQKMLKSAPREFESIMSTAKMYLKDTPNYCDLLRVLKLWHKAVYKDLQRSVMLQQDLHTMVALESTGQRFLITHDIDGVRDFSALRVFCRKLETMKLGCCSLRFQETEFRKSEAFLQSLTPLTISVYLGLGAQIECGED